MTGVKTKIVGKKEDKARSCIHHHGRRYVCAFCSTIFLTFGEIDKHFTEYHKLHNIYGLEH